MVHVQNIGCCTPGPSFPPSSSELESHQRTSYYKFYSRVKFAKANGRKRTQDFFWLASFHLIKTLLSNSVDPSVHPESSLNFRFFYHKHLGLVNLHPRPFRPILKPNILHVTLVYPPRSKKFTQYWSRRRTRHESVCHRWWVSSQI